jgi:hypothetical protein
MRIRSFVGMIGLVGVLSGCSSSSEDPDPKPDPVDPLPSDPNALPCGAIDSGFDGDEKCILPPDPGVGIQIHVGPTDYNDQAQIDEFILGPGEEITRCYYIHAPNEEPMNFFEQHYRMRPGSHHLIMHMSTTGETRAQGWDACDGDFLPIGGTQSSASQFPEGGLVAPEDSNLFRPLNAKALMQMELHFVNAGDTPLLREAWVNLIKKETDENSQILGGVFMIGGIRMAVQPHTKEILNYSCALKDGDHKRVVSLFGHRHSFTPRFSVWAHRGGVRELVYEDYDWQDSTELFYNTLMKNGAPDPVTRTAGGVSGLLEFNPGDRIEWECEVDNTSDNVLKFRNEVYTGEMCNLFGSAVGGAFWSCVPERATEPPPPAP